MYIDGVILVGLVVIALIVFMMIYIGRYANKHIHMDEKAAEGVNEQPVINKGY
jgi:uncharacterized membrane protein